MPEAEELDNSMQPAVDAVEQPQDEVPVKTFSADEVDAKIKQRIDKQNAKHAAELDEIQKELEEYKTRATKAESELAEFRHNSELESARSKIAAEFGLPSSIIKGESPEEMKEHAQEIKAIIPSAPVIIDSGESKTPSYSSREIFSKFMQENF